MSLTFPEQRPARGLLRRALAALASLAVAATIFLFAATIPVDQICIKVRGAFSNAFSGDFDTKGKQICDRVTLAACLAGRAVDGMSFAR
jgi:hypothetical protein